MGTTDDLVRMPRRLSRRGMLVAGLAASAAAAQTAALRLPRKIRLGMLGFVGHPGEIVGQLPFLPDVELTCFAECDEGDLRDGGRNRFIAKARHYTDYKKLLANEELDVVAVCNNNGDRAAAILAALRLGRHVIAEKPLALQMKDLEAIRKLASGKKRRIGMLLPMRFDSPYLAMRRVVEDGLVGEVGQASGQKSYKLGVRPAWQKNRSTFGGTIAWIAIHSIDLMRHTSGREFHSAFCLEGHVGFPEVGDMHNVTGSVFGLDNGGVAILRMDYLRPDEAPTHGDDRLRLAGTKGIVEYQAATGVTLMERGKAPRRLEKLPAVESVFRDFLEATYLGKTPKLPMDDVYRVTEITIRAQQAADEGRQIRF